MEEETYWELLKTKTTSSSGTLWAAVGRRLRYYFGKRTNMHFFCPSIFLIAALTWEFVLIFTILNKTQHLLGQESWRKLKWLWSTANKSTRPCGRQLMGRMYLCLELFCLEQLCLYRLAFLSTACKRKLCNQINYMYLWNTQVAAKNPSRKLLGRVGEEQDSTLSVNINLRKSHAETMKWLKSLHWYWWNIIHV